MFLQCSTLLVPICGEMATPLSLNFDGFARDMLGKDGNRRKKTLSAFLVWIYESIDRYIIYPICLHPLISFPPVCMPGAGNALKAFVRDICEGVHASMLQWSQLWALVGLIMGWNDHAKSVCVTVSFRIMVKQMHNSKCRIACMCENCDHGAIMCHTSFHLK